MKNNLIAIVALLFTCNMLFAQNAHFTTSGNIEFEKSANTYALIKRLYSKNIDDGSFTQQAFDQYKKTQPQFKVLKSILTFGDSKTLFSPVKDENASTPYFILPLAQQNNIIYSDLITKATTSQKTIFDQPFLVKDS